MALERGHAWSGGKPLCSTPPVMVMYLVLMTVAGSAVHGRDLEVLELHAFTLDQHQMLWTRAKEELGDVGKSEAQVQRAVAVQQRFFTSGFSHCAVSDKAKAAYVVIWKGGNNAIRCNMEMNENFSKDPVGKNDFPKGKAHVGAAAKVLRSDSGLRFRVPCSKVYNSGSELKNRMFTFVRDPISHFMSAYKEVEYRHSEDQEFQKQFAHKLGTVGRVQEFLWRILHNRYDHGSSRTKIYHVYLMSGMASKPKSKVKSMTVGRLETLEENWSQVQLWLGADKPVPFFDVPRCNHAGTTKNDPQGTAKAASSALAESDALHRALCYLTLPDFINFGYDLPAVCLDAKMNATLAELGNLSMKVLRAAKPMTTLEKTVHRVKGLVRQVTGSEQQIPVTQTEGRRNRKGDAGGGGDSDSDTEHGSHTSGGKAGESKGNRRDEKIIAVSSKSSGDKDGDHKTQDTGSWKNVWGSFGKRRSGARAPRAWSPATSEENHQHSGGQSSCGQGGTCIRKEGSVQTGKTLQFVHVHKCGGTTLCHLARKNSCSVRKHGKYNCNSAQEEWVNAAQLSGSVDDQKQYFDKHLTCTGFVANEFPLADDMWVNDTSYVYFTMMRDPIDRVHSHYKQFCDEWQKKGFHGSTDPCSTLDRFWEHNPDNWMTRQFCGRSCAQKARGDIDLSDLEAAKRRMDNMELVLVLEEFEAKGRFLLQERFGWQKLDEEHRNAHENSELSMQGNAHRLRQLNLFDIALFEYAQFLFQREYARSEHGGRDTKRAESMRAPEVSEELKREIEEFRTASSKCDNPCCLPQPEQEEPLRWSVYVRSICGAKNPSHPSTHGKHHGHRGG